MQRKASRKKLPRRSRITPSRMIPGLPRGWRCSFSDALYKEKPRSFWYRAS